MTAQNTETATAATEAPTTGTTSVVGAGEEFARLHPATLEVGPNVRDQVNTDSPASQPSSPASANTECCRRSPQSATAKV